MSFRGTTAPKDLITDASIAQAAWVEGEPEHAWVLLGEKPSDAPPAASPASLARPVPATLAAAARPTDSCRQTG